MSTTIVPALRVRAGVSSLLNAIKIPSPLTVRPALVGRTAPSKFCEVKTSPIWFPTKTDQTTLPPAPAKTVNSVSKPPNAIARPIGWNGKDMCLLFQDILPVAQEPVYATELEVDYVYKPYDEIYPLLAHVSTGINVQYLPYRLVSGPFEQVATVKIGFGEIVKYPYDVTIPIKTGIVATSEVGLLPIRVIAVKASVLAQSIGPTAPPVALLHMDGLDGATEFVDEMGNTWTSEYAKISYQKEKIGVSVGDFLIPTSSISCDSETINIGSNNFTLDFWFFSASDRTAPQCIYSTGREDLSIFDYGVYLYNRNTLRFRYKRDNISTGATVFTFASDLTPDQWHHVAVCRQGNTLSGFLDGVLGATATLSSTAVCGKSRHQIGNDVGNNYFTGYIDEVRLVLGLRLFNAAFELETQPYAPLPSFRLARVTVRSRVEKESVFISNKKNATLVVKVKIRSTTGYGFMPRIYIGDSTSRTIDGLGLTPGFVWIKRRSEDSVGVLVFDRLRGAFKFCGFSDIFAEATDEQSVTEFQDDGFAIGTSNSVNEYDGQYVSWVFAAPGTSTTISKQDVEDGYIANCTVSANPEMGISYGYYESNNTGAINDIGSYVYHGFDSEPDLVFVSNLTTGRNSITVGKLIGQDAYVTTYADGSVINEDPRKSKYRYLESRPEYLKISGDLDSTAGDKYAFYAFKNTPGKIATGKYAGGSSSDLKIEVGFKPAMLMLRMCHSLTEQTGFMIFDGSRGWNKQLGVDTADEIDTDTKITVDDTGFTVEAGSDLLAAQTTYLYMAVAGTLTSPLIS